MSPKDSLVFHFCYNLPIKIKNEEKYASKIEVSEQSTLFFLIIRHKRQKRLVIDDDIQVGERAKTLGMSQCRG